MKRNTSTGFTLVELVVVIVLIGILSAAAATKLFGRAGFAGPAFTEQLRAMARYGQKVAIAQNRPVYWSISPARVALCFDAACTVPVLPTGGQDGGVGACIAFTGWYCQDVPDDLTVVSGLPGLSFDEQGRPSAGLTITVSDRAVSQSITVEPETGYVH